MIVSNCSDTHVKARNTNPWMSHKICPNGHSPAKSEPAVNGMTRQEVNMWQMVSDRMNVFAVVWKRGFLYKTKHISKFPVNAAKFISNISPPSMVRVILSLESRIVTWIGFLFFGLAFSLKRKGKKKRKQWKEDQCNGKLSRQDAHLSLFMWILLPLALISFCRLVYFTWLL